MNYLKAILLFILLTTITPKVHSTTFSISVADLEQGLESARNSGDNPAQFLIDKIQSEISSAGLQFSEGDLVYQHSVSMANNSRCSIRTSAQFDATLTIDGRTNIEFIISSLSEPIVASADLYGNVDINGRARLRLGMKVLGKCIRIARETIRVHGSADLQLSLQTVLSLNPVLSEDKKSISFTPDLDLSGDLFILNPHARITDIDFLGVLSGLFERALNDAIDDFTDEIQPDHFNSRFNQLLTDKENEILSKIRTSIGGSTVTYQLPPIFSLLDELGGALAANGVNPIPLSFDYVEQNSREILYAYLMGDEEKLRDLLAAPIACNASKLLRSNMDHKPIYQLNNGLCSVLSGGISDTNTGRYYSDSSCQNQDIKLEEFLDYCTNQVSLRELGDPSVWNAQGQTETEWMLAHGSRYHIGVEPISQNYQPFVKKVNYKTVNNVEENAYTRILDYDRWRASIRLKMDCMLYEEEGYPQGFDPALCDSVSDDLSMENYMTEVARNGTAYVKDGYHDVLVDRDGLTYVNGRNVEYPATRGDGVCELEMRVYKKDIRATNLKPLIAFHGGAWRYRTLGILGLESEISNYTEQGYIVFLPFYRLAGDDEGKTECNGALWDNILEDADSALDWVKANGSNYGAKIGDVDLLGQSAGAYLSAYLANYRYTEIGSAILHYPATDVKHFIDRYNQGGYGNRQGRVHLEKFLGLDFDTLKSGSNSYLENLVEQLSIPNRVEANSNASPIYTLHGLSDELVPSDQSSRLCSAYGGSDNNSVGDFECGPSKMSLLAGAGHAFNMCVPGFKCMDNPAVAAQKMFSARTWAYGNTSGTNQLPISNAGSDKSASINQSVSVAGSGSDPDGHIASYYWKQISGSSVSISNSTKATMSFVTPSISQNSETLIFRLTVTDNHGATASDTMQVTVIKPNIAPSANAGSDRSIVRDKYAYISGSGNDPDGSIASYKWTQISGPTVSLINSTTSQVKLKAPNYVGAKITLQLKVTDDRGATASDTVTLTTINSRLPPGGGCNPFCQ